LVTEAVAPSLSEQDLGWARSARRRQIGILALQGDVREHAAMIELAGADPREVRQRSDLPGIGGLVIPGGESTTISMLLESSGLFDPLAEMIGGGLPVLGTCAGMILLAREVMDGRTDQRCFGAIDIVVRRNAFGRQVDSFETILEVDSLPGGPLHAVFIRAPYVEHVGAEVEVLARVKAIHRDDGWPQTADDPGRPVLCRQGRVTVAAFHPELAGERRLHDLLVSDVEGD
jgi:pyridoxal 5'-phosphate synthase pdxT subunit